MGPGGPRVRPEDSTDRATPARPGSSIPARRGVIGALPGRITGRPGSNARPHLRVARLRRHGFCYFSCHIGVKRPTRFAFPFRAAGKRPASSARLTSSPVPLLRRRDGRVHEGPVQAGRGRALGTSRDRPPRAKRSASFFFTLHEPNASLAARRSLQAKTDETRDGSDERPAGVFFRGVFRARVLTNRTLSRSKSATCYPSGTRT